MKKLSLLFLTIIFSICTESVLEAQDGLLDKSVQLKTQNEKLDKVLDRLSREGNFSFSYNSNIIDKNRLVTISFPENKLREILSSILGNEYLFLETEGYIVIRKRDFNTPYPWKKKVIHEPTDSAKKVNRETVHHIIDDLIKEKIITDKDSLVWFGLDNGQFIVNGKKLPDSLHILFRSKFIKPDGMGYYYGSVQITGKGYFLDKSDLY